MIVGIGSLNKAKIKACKKAVQTVCFRFSCGINTNISFLTVQTKTSVPDMPLNQVEMMNGALERALFVFRVSENIDFAIGLEGGVYRNPLTEESYLQNWVYVFDGREGHFGSSVSLPLPFKIVQALYEEKRELAEIIDRLSGLSDVRSQNGAFGVLTRDLITRSLSFEQALLCALTPFFNKPYYRA